MSLDRAAGALALIASLTAASQIQAQTLASADFSTFANGDLVGQGGWQPYQTATTAPIQIVGGKVT